MPESMTRHERVNIRIGRDECAPEASVYATGVGGDLQPAQDECAQEKQYRIEESLDVDREKLINRSDGLFSLHQLLAQAHGQVSWR